MSRITTLVLTVALFVSSSLYSPKADAAVSLIVKDRTALVLAGFSAGLSAVGGVVAATGGGTLALVGIALAPVSAAIGTIGFIAFGAIGIVLLDDDTVLEMNYSPIDLNNEKNYHGLNRSEVEIYNSEIEELNAIKKTIESELTEGMNSNDVAELWNLYKGFLSPETVKVAELKAYEISQRIK